MAIDSDVESSLIFGLDFQARALAAVPTEAEKSAFIVGTQSLKFSNQIYYLEFDEDSNRIVKQSVIHDAGEIWHISVSACCNNLAATCYQTVDSSSVIPGCKIWRLVYDESDEATNFSMDLVTDLNVKEYRHISGFLWNHVSNSRALVLADGSLLLTDLNNDLQVVSSTKVNSNEKCVTRLVSARWDPHHNSVSAAVAYGSNVSGWDIRAEMQTYLIENAHMLGVRDIDFNPNRPYILATSGNDGQVAFWDTRQTKERLHYLNNHSHWVWMIKYNPVHDQLLLSCSSDYKVALCSVNSLSSEQLEKSDLKVLENGDAECANISDGVIKFYTEHEESVYCCEWSAADPWLFASLSYDGRLVISRVPRQTKYAVLQL